MKQFVQDIFFEILRQLFGVQKKRHGSLILTKYAFRKMSRFHIDHEMLENTFRFGYEFSPGKISHRYANYSIGLYYRQVERAKNQRSQSGNRYVIITCWKGR